MSVIAWKPFGVPPAPVGDLTYRLILQRLDGGTARLMLVHDLAPGAVLHQSEGFGYLAFPVIKELFGHTTQPSIVPDSDIIGRWTVAVPWDVLEVRAFKWGVRLVWPDTAEVA